MANGTIAQTAFTDGAAIQAGNKILVKAVHVTELRTAVTALQAAADNVDNCGNCTAAVYCQSCQACQTCQSYSAACQSCQACQTCQGAACQSCQSYSCQGQLRMHSVYKSGNDCDCSNCSQCTQCAPYKSNYSVWPYTSPNPVQCIQCRSGVYECMSPYSG